MAIQILIPKEGMGMAEGTVSKWLKKDGERVTKDEVIAEIEAAKAMIDVQAPVSGVLRILLPEGQAAEVYTPIAEIDETC